MSKIYGVYNYNYVDDDEVDYDKKYDTNTLYVYVNDATKNDIISIIEDAINKIGKRCAYKLNLIECKDGSRFAYIRVSNVKVYNVLSDLNEDGSKRSKYIEDPDFIMPTISLDDALDNIEYGDDNDWSGHTEKDDEVRKRYICPKIKIELEPLIKLKSYNEENETISIMRAFVYDKNPPYVNNVLFFKSIPDWLNEKILRPYFAPFVTNKKERKKTKYGSKPYPLILFKTQKYGKCVYVTFSENSHDAHFCLLMNKILEIEYNGNNAKLYVYHLKSNKY
uniref:Uncharacterized protein n=1 Tax=Pithovirus LCPAC102 TaxID=2506587 RepID=A0A4D5XF45_9VIRU|nr:MAG: hypothetical protein LCPAC102_01370 [Pithovirus LCPAC102]